MAHVLDASTRPAAPLPAVADHPAYQAYLILHAGFVVLPIVAGLDKFFHVLVDWDMYLAPQVSQAVLLTANTFMLMVGLIEIIAGILVALRPRLVRTWSPCGSWALS